MGTGFLQKLFEKIFKNFNVEFSLKGKNIIELEKRLRDLEAKNVLLIEEQKDRPSGRKRAIVLADFENMMKGLEQLGEELGDVELGFNGIANFIRNITRNEGFDIIDFSVFSPDSMAREAQGWLNHLYSIVDLVHLCAFSNLAIPEIHVAPKFWTLRYDYPKDVDSVDWKMTFLGEKKIELFGDKIDRIYIVTGDYDFSYLKGIAEFRGIETKLLQVTKYQFARDYFKSWGGHHDIEDLKSHIQTKEEV